MCILKLPCKLQLKGELRVMSGLQETLMRRLVKLELISADDGRSLFPGIDVSTPPDGESLMVSWLSCQVWVMFC